MTSLSGKAALANGSIYVCNLPQGTDEGMLAEYFGTIGLLKVWFSTLRSRSLCFISGEKCLFYVYLTCIMHDV